MSLQQGHDDLLDAVKSFLEFGPKDDGDSAYMIWQQRRSDDGQTR
jgi:hypothetical protein